MISRAPKANCERFPLEQISLPINRLQSINSSGKKHIRNDYFSGQVELNENQIDRLKQLKSKYKKQANDQNLHVLSSNTKNKPVDTSFKWIQLNDFVKYEIRKFDHGKREELHQNKESDQNRRTQLNACNLHNQFDKKIQQSSHRLESNIDRVQDKLKILKQSYQKRHSFSNHQQSNALSSVRKSNNSKNKPQEKQNKQQTKGPALKQNFQPTPFSVKKQSLTKNEIQIDESSSKRAYAQQLKSINFIDQIKRKIQDIEKQTKSNLERKSSEISRSSKIINDKNEQNQSSIKKSYKITLANMAPNLAESQVIQTSQRERFAQRKIAQKKQSNESLVFQHYKFVSNIQTSRKNTNLSDEILEDPEVEQKSLGVSPALGKSPFEQKNLEETQMIERNELQGDLKIVEQEIQGEFVLLINRLGYQAEMDNKLISQIFKYDNVFSQKQSLKSIILSKMKQHYTQNQRKFDEKMFQVTQMQLDPLAVVQKIHQDFSPQQIMKVGFSLKKLYDKNSFYFENKLLHSFSHKTIEFLIEELENCHSLKPNEELNVGHLTSYVNMRTGKNLRNRCFYRILKRIVRNNSKIGVTFRKEDLFQAFARK